MQQGWHTSCSFYSSQVISKYHLATNPHHPGVTDKGAAFSFWKRGETDVFRFSISCSPGGLQAAETSANMRLPTEKSDYFLTERLTHQTPKGN